jgi:2,5-diamino-6-(ribosylamino)-4(3H)-pyrimidinone 5'-phosphate reductase
MTPKVVLHNAVSLDGRITGFVPDIGLYYSLVRVWKEEATLVGSETLIKAAGTVPEETGADFKKRSIRAGGKRPILVVPDSRGRIRTWHYWRRQIHWKDILVLCADCTPKGYFAYLDERNISYKVFGEKKVDFRIALRWMYSKLGIRLVRVDSGGTLNGVLLREGLVNEVSLLIHPVLVGGAINQSFFRAVNLNRAEDAIGLKCIEAKKLKNNLFWIRYRVSKQDKCRKRQSGKENGMP